MVLVTSFSSTRRLPSFQFYEYRSPQLSTSSANAVAQVIRFFVLKMLETGYSEALHGFHAVSRLVVYQ